MKISETAGTSRSLFVGVMVLVQRLGVGDYNWVLVMFDLVTWFTKKGWRGDTRIFVCIRVCGTYVCVWYCRHFPSPLFSSQQRRPVSSIVKSGLNLTGNTGTKNDYPRSVIYRIRTEIVRRRSVPSLNTQWQPPSSLPVPSPTVFSTHLPCPGHQSRRYVIKSQSNKCIGVK